MFYFNYIRLCNSINKSPSAVAEEMGFKRSVVTRWRNGVTPRATTLQKIADYFGVPVEELTKENSPSPKTETERSYVDVATKRIWSPAPVSILVAQYNVPSAVLADIAACTIHEAEQLALGTTFGTADQLSRVASVFSVALDDLTRGWVPLYANPAVLADIARRTLDRFPTLADR